MRGTTETAAREAWNPRYLEYCRQVSGIGPDETMDRDAERYPGGCMTGYILWVGARWAEWRAAHGVRPHSPRSAAQHAHFDAWLAARTPAPGVPAEAI